jgi:3-hydroxybutyryl-CoA dehydrogenase
MKLLVVGNDDSLVEVRAKFGSKHAISFKNNDQLSEQDINSAEAIFDFIISPDHQHGQLYRDRPEVILLVNSVINTVSDLVTHFDWNNPVIGFNGMPGMFNRPLLELAVDQTNPSIVSELCQGLHTDYKLVTDRLGMVTPRVISMIINEACYTVQEGTATQEDIDLAMKLGTNYPEGPFEMLMSLGIKNVYHLLEALHQGTGEARYKVSPLLRKLYQQQS